MSRLLRFPDPVNEVSARLVAAGVVVMAALILGLRQPWLLVPIAYGFVARVATGPTLSPLGQLVTRVITPRLPLASRPVPGPPKRFAQGIGAVVTVTAALLALVAGLTAPAYGLVVMLLVFASLESFAGFCVGCTVFAALMRAGVIPASVCQRCLDVRRQPGQAAARG
ncbi:MAG TPA: DUF4395 domain-containing protein [Candidatus Dormibacteraeota bacterium]|nr:DUF4395 domain-containing protein [Candidatus Dormibacteraeota bacterium]